MTWETSNNNTTWFKWNRNSSATDPMWGRDKIGVHYVKMHGYTDTPEHRTEQPAIIGTRPVRCDSRTHAARVCSATTAGAGHSR
ncbi:MAG: hypothetical protein HOZ81_39125 [Streptomyces sp.]|nr:hypothetical protein [Streptomyces sp.]